MKLSKTERVIHSVLLTSAAIVSVLTIGIGYQQQTSGAMRAEVRPFDEPLFEEFVEVDLEPVEEPMVWCCNDDPNVGLCYEQPAANGCNKGVEFDDTDDERQFNDFDTCFSACSAS